MKATETENTEKNVITFNKPYKFEGTEYTEIDLSGLDKLTIKDAIDIQKQLTTKREVAATVLTETSTAFARMVIAKATGYPIEFFEVMPRSLSKQVQQAVMMYLNVDTQTENHVMTFDKPYSFEGKSYKDIDLSKIGDLTSLNESEAENRMAREGIISPDNTANYFYSCILASMATGQPEEFFTGLPFKEILKLKLAVNDPSFFE
jgi:hypothetical protein